MLDEIIGHARASSPEECCGLLLGSGDRADVVFRAHNLEKSPTRFQIDPLDHFAAIRAARSAGRRIVGVYHSHPQTAARPSPADLADASYREYLYLIVGLGGEAPEVNVFRLEDGRFVGVPFVTIE